MIKQDGPKKNRMKNFHKMTLKMILFASPMERETVPDKPVDSCKRFMNCKSVALKEQELNNQFRILRHGQSELLSSIHGKHIPGNLPLVQQRHSKQPLSFFLLGTQTNSSFGAETLSPHRPADPHVRLRHDSQRNQRQTRSPSPNELPQTVGPADNVCNRKRHFLQRIQRQIPKHLVPSLADGTVQINFQGDGTPSQRISFEIPPGS
jgi:hypothetical protein